MDNNLEEGIKEFIFMLLANDYKHHMVISNILETYGNTLVAENSLKDYINTIPEMRKDITSYVLGSIGMKKQMEEF